MSLTRTPYNLPCIFLDHDSDKEEMVNQILVEMSQMKERQKDLDNKMENMKSENEILRQKYTQQQKIIEDAQSSDKMNEFTCNDHVKAYHLKKPPVVGRTRMDEKDQVALQLMVKIKTEEGVNQWQCTVCLKQHYDKTLIRKYIKRVHV